MERVIRHLAVLVVLGLTSVALVVGPAGAKPTWQPVTNMYADLSAVGGSAQAPDVAVDAEGNATAVWSRSTGSGFVVQAATREAGGAWSAPVDLTTASNGYDPQVVVDAAGNATAIWRARAGEGTVVQAAGRPAGGVWSAPVDLATDLTLDHSRIDVPQIAVDAAGNVTATWSRYDAFRFVVQAASRPAGGAWTTPVDLSAPSNTSANSSLALDPAGNATVVWTTSEGSGGGYAPGSGAKIQAATRPAGGTWSSAVDVTDAGPSSYVYEPRVVVGRTGEVTAIWLALSGAYVVQSATRPAQGPWTAPETLSAPGADTSNPDVAVDGQGTTTAVWQEHDGDNWIVKGARRAAGGAWSDGVDLSAPGQDAINPQAVGDSAGNTTAIWTRSDGTAERIQAATQAAGGTWTEPLDLSAPGDGPSSIPFLENGEAHNPEIAVDPAGNVTAVWSRFDGNSWIVQARGLDAAGPVVAALTSPPSGTTGKPLGFEVTASDVWSSITDVAWDFGDGQTASGASVTHTYANPGTRTVTVTLTDAVGNATTRTRTIDVAPAPVAPPQVDPPATAPEITGLRLKPKQIEIHGPKRRTRTAVVLRLTEDARVTLTIQRKGVTGKKVRSAVVLRKSLDSGSSKLRLTSKQLKRKLGKRSFVPGRYTLTVTAVNDAGKDSRSTTLRVRR
ncbi:PKD domain-containing protein [Nocardioides seonyuensis]|uniref:PKD domain-containing protein n=1 Tax=Nocardioides seonyuensis TaxID=2518371 RepID=A0A4P7IBL8_9ACTN|nr:PKD domain-containing protein [Nocardioides seonyuensis]QBX54464.1 PKD domain-containing protein [Nocardioides seonyuensis]